MKETNNPVFSIRPARKEDAALIFHFIESIAIYEKMLDKVVNSEELIRSVVFDDAAAEAVIAEVNGRPIGFMLWFKTYSTFVGRQGIHLEDLYLDPEYRGRGYGKKLLTYLADYTVKHGYGRLEWCCLNWNEPSIKFYRKLGAESLDEWITFRLDGERLKTAADLYE